MSYNGSGTFQINTSGQPVVAGTVISSTAFNALTADLATGLSTAITKDGQTATTVRIPFAQGISSTLVTDSSSISTGSIITAGGVGIAKNLYVGVNANIAGTLGVTGVATFSAAPIYSSLTASSAVATDASKALVSVTNTGTGNNVLATSPTLVTPALGTPSAIVLTNATSIPSGQLTGTQTIPKSTLPVGSVLQVITASTTTATNTASTSPVDSTLTATITPSSNTSKILVMVNQSVGKQTDASASTSIDLVRGVTTIANISAFSLFTGVTTPIYGASVSNNYLDSPATTSATTYKTQLFCNTASGDAMTQPNNSLSTITLMEIAA
jgi:hypothetical protein